MQMRLRELYFSGKDNLKRHGVDNPALESYLLLSKTNAISNISEIYTHPEKEMESETVGRFYELLDRRATNEPAAYILGQKEFYSRPFTVNPKVLIPRPETELLAEETVRLCSTIDSPTVLDLGTGSGCIAVTVASENSSARVFASDISEHALDVAKENAWRNSVADRISFIQGDLLSSFQKQAFDIVVSNPPYVSESEFRALEPEVKDCEPALALLAGRDGLSCIKKIVTHAPRILKDGGWCLVEIGAGQSSSAMGLFEETGYSAISAHKDISNTERVIKAQWKK
jgi:release factor glutamine methyltransferase